LLKVKPRANTHVKDASFRALQLLNKQEREKREQEADKEAGVEPGMGLNEELRKRRAKEEAKAQKQTREGKQRESLALRNLEATAHLEVIQRTLEELPKLPCVLSHPHRYLSTIIISLSKAG
jgi:hypothetical protein